MERSILCLQKYSEVTTMGWYEAIKDGIAVAQQADNIPLVEKLIDAQKQIFDLVDENHRLRDQIRQMEETSEIASTIERHDDAYITLADDPDKRIYCSCCWDTKRMLVQGQKTGVGTYSCPSCGSSAFYDRVAHDQHQKEAIKGLGNINSPIRLRKPF